MIRFLRLTLALGIACFATFNAPAQTPPGYVRVHGTKILNTVGVPVPSAQLCAQVADSSQAPYSIHVGTGGQTTKPPVCVAVVNGAFSIYLPDTAVSRPLNACIAITVRDTLTYDSLIDEPCVQPTTQPSISPSWCSAVPGAADCNFDAYLPDVPSVGPSNSGPTGQTGADGKPGIQGPQGTPGQCSTNGSLCPVSRSEAWMSQIGCPQGVDPSTGKVWGTNMPPLDAAPCINAYLAAHVAPNLMLILHQDGVSAISGIFGPHQGGWGIVGDAKPGIAKIPINSCVIASGILTCSTTPQNLAVGQGIILQGFTASGYLNGRTPVVLSSGLSSVQFEASVGLADATVEAGFAQVVSGNGFYQLYGSNNDMIHNGAANYPCSSGNFDPGWLSGAKPPARGFGLIFKDLMLNGNRGDGYSGNSTSGIAPGSAYFGSVYGTSYCSYLGINVMDMSNTLIDDVYAFNISAYGIGGMNVDNFTVSNSDLDPFGPGVTPYEANTDGIHIRAPAEKIFMTNDRFRTGDDAFCLCAEEGYPSEISDVVISDPMYDGALSGGRLITEGISAPFGPPPTIKNVTITGPTGMVQTFPFHIGDEFPRTNTATNSITGLNISDATLEIKSVPDFQAGLTVGESVGDMTLSNVTFNGVAASAQYSRGPGWINLLNNSTIHSLTFSNVTQGRNASGHSTAPFINTSTTGISSPSLLSIDRLTVNGARVVDTDGGSYGNLNYFLALAPNTHVGRFFATGIDFFNIGTCVNPAALSYVSSLVCNSNLTVGGLWSSTNMVIGTGAGTGTAAAGAVTTAMGTDTTHVVVITTGGAPAAQATIYTGTFTQTRANMSYCTISPANPPSEALYGPQAIAVNGDAPNTYRLISGPTPLAPNTPYAWNITCPGN